MSKTNKLLDRAEDVRPYVDRALRDEELRENLKGAYAAARDVYNELLGGRGAVATAQRVATDEDIQKSLKKAIDELRTAADRVQGKEDHSTRNKALLLAGITAGILFNPKTGPQTRKWIMDKVTGETDSYDYNPEPSTNGGATNAEATV
jgi:hypothetical protein